jgi:hypothetical protein
MVRAVVGDYSGNPSVVLSTSNQRPSDSQKPLLMPLQSRNMVKDFSKKLVFFNEFILQSQTCYWNSILVLGFTNDQGEGWDLSVIGGLLSLLAAGNVSAATGVTPGSNI